MKALWLAWPKVKKKIFSARKKILFLDFDGTLVPIARMPEEVSIPARTHRTLAALSQKPDYRVVIVSGRCLKDIRSRLALKNVFYIGNHGSELQGKGMRLPAAAVKARRLARRVGILARKLAAAFSDWPGVFVENKNFTFSVHFRNLPADQRILFCKLLGFFRERYGQGTLVWKRGKKVWEIHPNQFFGKGEIVRHFLRCFPMAFPVAIGDDRMDEEMFRVLRHRGVTIRVGYSKRSCAQYYLKSTAQVAIFLEKL